MQGKIEQNFVKGPCFQAPMRRTMVFARCRTAWPLTSSDLPESTPMKEIYKIPGRIMRKINRYRTCQDFDLTSWFEATLAFAPSVAYPRDLFFKNLAYSDSLPKKPWDSHTCKNTSSRMPPNTKDFVKYSHNRPWPLKTYSHVTVSWVHNRPEVLISGKRCQKFKKRSPPTVFELEDRNFVNELSI